MTVQEIYQIIDKHAPFGLQESWDKSGLLVGDPSHEVRTVLLTLDITTPVAKEAARIGADLILSHHPVIWDPLRTVTPTHPVWHLVQNNIAAICAHTNLDIAEGGLNDMFGDLIADKLLLEKPYAPFVTLSPGRVLGRTAQLRIGRADDMVAILLKKALHANVRYNMVRADPIEKIAWCTGSGGDLLQDAAAAGADGLITADCKHSVWAEAENLGISLFDCGHFHTEVHAVKWFEKVLAEDAPDVKTVISENGTQSFYDTY